MHPAIPTSAEQGALPPGLAEAAAAHLEPGEALRWAGRGTRSATFLALAPGMALLLLFTGAFGWAALAGDGWRFQGPAPPVLRDLPPETLARGVVGLIAAIPLYYLFLFIRRVARARSDIALVTDRRLIFPRGRRSTSFPLADIERAEARGSLRRPALAWRMIGHGRRSGAQPALFGVANAEAGLAELAALGVPTEDNMRGIPGQGPEPLAPGELVRWSARRGWRAAGKPRLIIMALCAPLPLPFLLSLWWVWNTGMPIAAGILFTLVLAAVFGPMAWFVLRGAIPFFGDMLVDMFGTLAVTDRRILFVRPLTRTVDRHIRSERLLGVDLVETRPDGSGQIALRLVAEPHWTDSYLEPEEAAQEKREPEEMDLFAVPEAAAAAAAMSRLVRR